VPPVIRDALFFCQTSFHHLSTVGTFIPGGPALAEVFTGMLRRLDASDGRRILEIGPGTGPITRAIEASMRPEDSLTCVEIIPDFARWLEQWRVALPRERRHRVRVVEGDFLQAACPGPYDMIICGVPLGLVPAPVVEGFFERFAHLSHEHAIISTYEYLGSRNVRRQIPGIRKKLLATEEVIRKHRARAELGKQWVVRHLPPMLVSHYSARALKRH
jgi:phosphatidylserine decarboxylase